MSKEQILARVVGVLAQSFQLDSHAIKPTSHLFEELELDSIDAIDLMVGLEEETGIKLSEDELHEIRRVQDVVDAIYRRMEAA
jgi:acyl carrier protein